jgi:isopentenyl-diphosphate delta-isomerase type 1
MRQDPGELFDVVDEADRVVGRAPRAEVHARGLRHRAVHAFVVDGAGRVYLHRRTMTKDSFPGRWTSSCAGHVGAGDDYDAAMVRELGEELGLRPDKPPERLLKVAACPATGQEFVWVYRVAFGGVLVPDPDEIDTGGWYEPAVVDRWLAERPGDFADSFVLLWPLVRPRLAGA